MWVLPPLWCSCPCPHAADTPCALTVCWRVIPSVPGMDWSVWRLHHTTEGMSAMS